MTDSTHIQSVEVFHTRYALLGSTLKISIGKTYNISEHFVFHVSDQGMKRLKPER
ncbi:MAG: hypothetical protein Kow0029_03930 [Candidatus Rifleibacteriota bacterium]